MTDRELAAAYVLGELDAPELAEFELRLEREPALRSEVEATRLLSAGRETLPADAWPGGADPRAAEVEAPRLAARHPGDERATAPNPLRRRLVRPAYALAAVAAALVIGIVVGDLIGGSGSGGSGSTTVAGGSAVALRPLEGGSKSGAVVHVGDGTVELDTHGLPRSGPGHYYELWLMTNDTKLVPVASFGVGDNGAAKVRVPLPADPSKFRYYDISRQRVGGGAAHSTESVLRAPTS